jgi:hypothetical protein
VNVGFLGGGSDASVQSRRFTVYRVRMRYHMRFRSSAEVEGLDYIGGFLRSQVPLMRKQLYRTPIGCCYHNTFSPPAFLFLLSVALLGSIEYKVVIISLPQVNTVLDHYNLLSLLLLVVYK